MDNKIYDITILGGSEPMVQQYAVNSILSRNEDTSEYGLALTAEQAQALVLSRNESLKASGRIELGGGVIEKLIHFFAGSPYTNAENYEETPTASQTFSTASREIHGNLFQTISSSNL